MVVALCPRLGSTSVGMISQDRVQCMLLLSNESNCYLELSTKLLSTKEYILLI